MRPLRISAVAASAAAIVLVAGSAVSSIADSQARRERPFVEFRSSSRPQLLRQQLAQGDARKHGVRCPHGLCAVQRGVDGEWNAPLAGRLRRPSAHRASASSRPASSVSPAACAAEDRSARSAATLVHPVL